MPGEGSSSETWSINQNQIRLAEWGTPCIRNHHSLSSAAGAAQIFGQTPRAGGARIAGDHRPCVPPECDRLSAGCGASIVDQPIDWNIGESGQ
jgi:hypothetical protein